MTRWRNCSTEMSSDGQRANLPQNYRGRPSFISVSFWWTGTRESMPANANNSVLAKHPSRSWVFSADPKSPTKNHQRPGDSEDKSDAKVFSVLTLKLASNRLHIPSSNWCEGSHSKGALIKFLSRSNISKTRASVSSGIPDTEKLFQGVWNPWWHTKHEFLV